MQGMTSGWGTSLRGLGALIALIVRYPEVSTVQYDPGEAALTVSFLIRGPLEGWEELESGLREMLEAYRALMGDPARRIEFQVTPFEGISVVSLIRDTGTLSVEEIGMAIEVLHDRYDTALLADPHDLMEEELVLQEETIQAGLEALRMGTERNLIALREEGRVVVFNT
ncbi:conserved protein of unknown function [Candidatus Hydrogenisulfobacillus filiaventi]|uniref:Uncharacterized protein n=1 Tax=Candidatus Hydrogenisulfobacillus filiaventi TaxID=2707344 RepID=A0A6F8ZG63_9FIRM|nr:hypothetical protein [Bacillota bacterium]CAB1128871.1 conserved protein of unknown function [Candidatus Hydrogenisulfobacillus filiaventi]